MFCPRCGFSQTDEVKFCKSCGANLLAVRQVLDPPKPGEKFDWSKTWLAEMFLSADEIERRKDEVEQRRGLTPEIKRINEIKGGVITASIGIGVMIFLKVLMEGIIRGGKVPDDASEILKVIWVAGLFPLLTGLALIINGVFVSRRLVAISKEAAKPVPVAFPTETDPQFLRAAPTSEIRPPSVTDHTTKHLAEVRSSWEARQNR